MPRSKRDGTPASAPNRRNLTELYVRKTRPKAVAVNVWDEKERGLVLRIQPSGFRSYKFVYSIRGRARWYHIGVVPLSDARRIAAKFRLAVAEGRDPLSERRAERGRDSFRELADLYLEQHAKKKNKSWPQARAIVERHLLPRWGRLTIATITRADVRQLMSSISAPVAANQALAAASAIFSWAVTQEVIQFNPCVGVERNEVRSRERILSDGEVKQFWQAVDIAGLVRSYALKVVLLTGQRPGEVVHMCLEHIKDGSWWEMPGNPDPKLGWPGTKNGASHRVWLVSHVRNMISELSDGETTGFVFTVSRGKPVSRLPDAMQQVCAHLGIDSKITPHDLRRTHGSTITRLGFGRDAMNRIQNHKEGGISSVYDRHQYADENKLIMEKVGAHLLAKAKE